MQVFALLRAAECSELDNKFWDGEWGQEIFLGMRQ